MTLLVAIFVVGVAHYINNEDRHTHEVLVYTRCVVDEEESPEEKQFLAKLEAYLDQNPTRVGKVLSLATAKLKAYEKAVRDSRDRLSVVAMSNALSLRKRSTKPINAAVGLPISFYLFPNGFDSSKNSQVCIDWWEFFVSCCKAAPLDRDWILSVYDEETADWYDKYVRDY